MFKSISVPVVESSQVGEARRTAHRLATEMGLSETVSGHLGIIATELGTNLYKHATFGELIIRKLRRGESKGIEIISLDRGPGMVAVARCMEDGYSTAGTSGNGLGSIKRLSHLFDIYSNPQGTAIVSQLWDSPPQKGRELQIGAICLPYPGEISCGDAWSIGSFEGGHSIIVADGLGHGVDAAKAADFAVTIFEQNQKRPPQQNLQMIHDALRATRGAAVLLINLFNSTKSLTCSGIGNISGSIIKGDLSKSFVSLNGTVGHQVQRFQDFNYEWWDAALIVIHSDGLQTKWKLNAYPGLQTRHPSLVAAILYRDFRRSRDDVTVLVVKEALINQ